MPFTLTFTGSRRDTLTLEADFLEFEAFAEILQNVEVGEKDGSAVIPALFRPCPEGACLNAGKAGSVDCGGGRPHRLSANVEAITALGVDIDDVPEDRIVALLGSLEARGLAFFVWETYGHAPPENARARILIPFDKPMPLVSAAQWSKGAWPNLVRHLGIENLVTIDSVCTDPARVYYLPRKPDEASERESDFFPGACLDWEKALGGSLNGFEKAALVRVEPPRVDETKPVDLEAVREKIKSCHTFARPFLQRVLRGEAPVGPPGKRAPDEPPRYSAWRTVTSAVSLLADEWMSTEALLSILHPAWQAEVAESPKDFTPWETIEGLFQTARASAPLKRAEAKAKRDADRDVMLKNRKRKVDLSAESGEPTLEETLSKADSAGFAASWRAGLKVRETQDGERIAVATPANITHVLMHHPDWAGKLRLNVLTQNFEIGPGCPLNSSSQFVPFTDHHYTRLVDWLENEPDLRMKAKKADVVDRADAIAFENKFDPLVEFLNSLPEWDGVERLPRLFQTYFGASNEDEDEHDISDYLGAVGVKFPISCVARALQPGAKVDTIVVLEGPQGINKSTSLRDLAGQEFFSDNGVDAQNRDGQMMCARYWIIEMAELSSLRRTELNAFKGFVSRQFDNYRPPYGRRFVDVPRRCVFVGSCNDAEYLKDITGNRRIWPIKCGTINRKKLNADRSQIWAEARARFERGEVWWLTGQEEAVASAQVEDRTVVDPLEDQIVDWFLGMPPEKRPDFVRVADIIAGLDLHSTQHDTRIANALRRLGFHRVRRVVAGRKERGFLAPKAILTHERRSIAGAQRVTQASPTQKEAKA